MAVVKKVSSGKQVRKKQVSGSGAKLNVQSTRQPSIIQEMGDTAFGTLDSSKNGLLVSYDSGTDKFVLVSADSILSTSVEDFNLPDDFITQLEDELDLGAIQIDNFDGGTF
jgi:hypothetical protein